MMKLGILAALLYTCSAFPATQQQYPQTVVQQQYPAQQEVKPQLSALPQAHHGFMYAPQQQTAQLSQYPSAPVVQTTPAPMLTSTQAQIQEAARVLMTDPDFQMLARSLHTGTGSVGFSNPLSARELPPCSSDGRSVTIDHLRISPESLVQIARLAQAFGTNPDWKKLRLADMKSALDTQMHPTHQYAARSIGL